MPTYDNRSEVANVVASFDSQDDADEAVLELRELGFRDQHIGYFSYSPDGGPIELLDRNHWFAGATVGTIVGGVIGVCIARAVVAVSAGPFTGLDPWGLAVAYGVVAALFGEFVGGLIGMGIPRRSMAAPVPGPDTGPFVIAVSAGEARDQARTALSRHGGHELRPEGAPAAHPA